MTLVQRSTEGHVATVKLDRAEALNALSGAFADQLADAFRTVATEPEVWVVVLAASGERAFCVGADLKERNQLDDAGWMRNRLQMRGMFDALRAIPQPTIGSAFGHALGGGFELLLSCDLVVAADDTVLGLPEVGVGIVPAGGGTQLLARKVGLGQAKELIFTRRRISAEEGFAMGLVTRVVEREALETATEELAREICAASPIAVREAKRAIARGLEVPLEQGLDVEDVAWRRAVASEDRKEGIAAFNEKRQPKWSNR
jgi:enoyl-CoA hydratase/carnithine racemase